MAISTKGTVLTVKKSDNKEIEVKIKSFPDLGVAPAAIDVTYHMDPVPGACADAQLYGLCDDHGDPSQR